MDPDRPGLDPLLFRLFPHSAAIPRLVREDPALADLDLRAGAGRRQAGKFGNSRQADGEGLMRNVRALVAVGALALAAAPVVAQEMPEPAKQDWSFYGPFGTYDRAALQR